MKNLPQATLDALATRVLTWTTCVKVTRMDGQVFGFTSFNRDLVLDGVTYKSDNGAGLSALRTTSDMSVDNAEIRVPVIDSPEITPEDILAGIWHNAEYEQIMVNYYDTTMQVIVGAGNFGNITLHDVQARVETRSLLQRLQQVTGEVISPYSHAELGDSTNPDVLKQNNVDLSLVTVNGSITSVTDNRFFADSLRTEPAEWFRYGTIKFTSGQNSFVPRRQVKKFQVGGQFEMLEAMPFAVAVGDSYEAIAGWDATLEQHTGKFGQDAADFRGERHVPGNDFLLSQP